MTSSFGNKIAFTRLGLDHFEGRDMENRDQVNAIGIFVAFDLGRADS